MRLTQVDSQKKGLSPNKKKKNVWKWQLRQLVGQLVSRSLVSSVGHKLIVHYF